MKKFEKQSFISRLNEPLDNLIECVYARGYHEGRDELVTWLINNGYELPEDMCQLKSKAFSQIMEKMEKIDDAS